MKWISLTLALLVVASASAQKPVNVPAAIKTIYDAQNKDLVKGDLTAFFAYYDPAFVNIGADGKKHTLADLKQEVEAMVKGSSKRSFSIKFTGCKATPNVVDVSYIADFNLVVKGNSQKLREVGTDTWKKEGNAWKEVKTVDKSFGPTK